MARQTVESEIKFCPNCGTARFPEARFCGQCRYPFVPVAPPNVVYWAVWVIVGSLLVAIVGTGWKIRQLGQIAQLPASTPSSPAIFMADAPSFTPTTPTPTLTVSPSLTPSPTPTTTPSPSPSVTFTSTPSPTNTPLPTATPSSLPTATPNLGGSVVEFSLVNAATNRIIRTLVNGDTISLGSLSTTSLNIVATVYGNVGSVYFEYDGRYADNKAYGVENVAPYAMMGDVNGDYNSWTPSTGTHTVKAIPYSQTNRRGVAGTSYMITFTVTR